MTMSLLVGLESGVESLWFEHEEKFEVLNDFLPLHGRLLQSLHVNQGNREHTKLVDYVKSYLLGRDEFRKDLVALHVNLQCNADLQKVMRTRNKRKRQTTTIIDSSTKESSASSSSSSSAEQLAANICACSAISLKRRLETRVQEYNNLVDHLQLWKEKRDDDKLGKEYIHLPLHTHPSHSLSQALALDSAESAAHQHLTHNTHTNTITPEALLEYRLVCKLQRRAKASSDIVKYIGDEQMQWAVRG